MKIHYRFEYCGNSEYVALHVDYPITEQSFISSTYAKGQDLELLQLFSGIAGALEISLRKYQISAQRGKAFDRDTVLQNLLGIFKMWVAVNVGKCEYEQLPTLRTDLAVIQCPECQRIMKEECARAMRDFDSIDY